MSVELKQTIACECDICRFYFFDEEFDSSKLTDLSDGAGERFDYKGYIWWKKPDTTICVCPDCFRALAGTNNADEAYDRRTRLFRALNLINITYPFGKNRVSNMDIDEDDCFK